MVSAAAGAVLAVTITSGGINSLVGTAISAGLLPPLVNSGMLMAYAGVYAPPEKRWDFYEMGLYAVVFYLSHVVTIFCVANTIFWLKEIDPRFSSAEDNSYKDLPSVAALVKRKAEGGNFFLDNLKNELDTMKEDIEDFGSDFTHKATGLATGLVEGVKSGVQVLGGKPVGHRGGDADLESGEGDGGGVGMERGKAKVPLDDIRSSPQRTRHRSRSRAVADSAVNGEVGYEDEPGMGKKDTKNPMFDFL